MSRLQHLYTDLVENIVSKSPSIIARELFAMATCLFRCRYLITGLHATIWTQIHVYIYMNACKRTYDGQSKSSRNGDIAL
jgi:hypothetical protein